MVAAADYDGHVSIWDVEKSTDNAVKIFRDHTKRCLAVDFNKLTPNIFASGSEDNKVGFILHWGSSVGIGSFIPSWSMARSIRSLLTKASAHFNPF